MLCRRQELLLRRRSAVFPEQEETATPPRIGGLRIAQFLTEYLDAAFAWAVQKRDEFALCFRDAASVPNSHYGLPGASTQEVQSQAAHAVQSHWLLPWIFVRP